MDNSPKMPLRLKLLLGLLAVTVMGAATYTVLPGPVVTDTIADALLIDRRVFTSGGRGYVLVERFSSSRTPWAEPRKLFFEANSTLPTNGVYSNLVFAVNGGRLVFRDAFSGNTYKPDWWGGEPSFTLAGYTNRFTWEAIPVDSREAMQSAIDWATFRGGGIVDIGPGEWRFGDSTNPGTVYLKPKVRLRGAGMPTVENAFSGSFSMEGIAGRITATMLHFAGGSTNGFGAPCIALVGSRDYTNQYSSWFYDANTEVVWYRSGGNEISDLGIWSGWKWPWNGTNPPGAAILINEVSEVAINRVFIGPTAGPGIYRRGAFGNKISGSYIASTLSPGIVTVDTSDTVISDSTIVASSGSAMTFTGELRTNGTFQNTANTHRMYGLEVWNNNTELVGWRDSGQTTTNWTTVENSDTRRDGYSADASTDLIGNPFRIGADTGMPVFVGGTDLPGGLSTNVPYYVRWGAAGGTNFYLCNTAGRALNGGAVVDITSGGTNWYLYAPQAIIHAHGSEEIQIDGMRADQSWAGILDLTKAPRVLVNGLHAWELGYNQIARDRRQTWYDPNIVAVRLRDVNTFVMSGSMVSGSKGNSGVGVPWIHNSFGVVAHGLRDGNISGNLFDRVDTGILLDDQSGNVGIDPGQFGSWVSRPVVAPSGLYGVAPNNPYWDAKGSAQIVAPITSGYTNVTGDWSVAIKVRVPDQPTNAFLYHNAVFNLSSVTNADFSSTNYNALVERSVVYSFYRSVTDSSMNFAGLHIGTNYPGVAGVDDKRFNMDVTPFIGKDVEIVVQRSNNWQQLWLNGEKRAEFPLSDWISTGVVYAPFFIVGQLKNSTNLSHLTTPLYGIAYHHRGFSDDEINSGLPWAGTNAVLLYDFRGDSAAGGVLDKSGRGHNGLVQQTGSSTPEFGSTDDAMFTAGSGMTITRTGKKSWTFSSSGGSGVTDGDKGDITVASSGASWTIDADAVALATDTTGNFVATVAGTANEVSVSGSGSENAAVTLSLPSTIDLGGKTSFEVPNGASPTVDAFGEIAADNDAWAASRGAIVAYDGTASTRLVGVLSSDTPSNGQVPVWNTGGTITWETQSGSGTAISTNGGNTAGLPVVIHGDASFGTTNSLTISNLTVDVLALTSPIDSSSITNAMATDAEVAAGYQPLDADLTDLADGSLTGSKVGSGIDDDNVAIDDADGVFTATTLGSALEELNDSINAGAPNGTGAKVHWSQLLGVPGGFADGSDDGAGGASITNLNDLGDVDGATPSTNSLLVFDGTAWTKTNSPTISGTLSVEGTNSATLDMGDAQSTPKFATLAAPTTIQTNYQIVLPSNAIPGFVQASSLTATSLVLNPVASTGSGSVVLSAGPTLTGDPVAPTASPGDNDTSVATTAFVTAADVALRAANYWQATNANLTTLAGASITGSGNFMRTRTGVPREIWIPANAMSPGSDAPTAATNVWATTTDGHRIESWDFSATSTNSLYWTMTLPSAWDGSTVKAKVFWKQVSAEATSTNVFAIGGGSLNDAETGGNTLGTLVLVTDVGLNDTNQVAISSASSAITIGGTPSAGHLTWFTLRRHPGDTGDNSSVIARVLGVHMQYTETSTEPSAW